MCVTESRMIDLAAQALGRARDQVAAAGEESASGLRVERPSQDVPAWSEGMRASARALMSGSRGSAIARSKDRLSSTDTALGALSDVLARVKELGVEFANDTVNAAQREDGALEVGQLLQSAIGAANSQDQNGEYVLAGSRIGTTPFDPQTAQYAGDADARSIESSEGVTTSAGITGQALTAGAGPGTVDVMGSIAALQRSLGANDGPGIRSSLDGLDAAIRQVAEARAAVGVRMNALDQADNARQSFELRLASVQARTVEADAVGAASDFASSKTALESAQALAQQIVDLTKPPAI
jgi:flagellar hook-associated protein 3 FlgL